MQLFEYERLVKILLHAVADTEQEGFVQRIAIYLLNSLACLVDGKQKLFLGDLGAIGVSNYNPFLVFAKTGTFSLNDDSHLFSTTHTHNRRC